MVKIGKKLLNKVKLKMYMIKIGIEKRKKKMEDMMRRSMENLVGVAKGIILPPREL